MRLVTVGSVALDSLKTPHGSRTKIIGGAAVHASVAASFFISNPGLVGVIGEDFPEANLRLLRSRGVDLGGLVAAKGRTFHWKGGYSGAMGLATTHRTDLGVFATFDLRVPAQWRNAPFLFLANIEPSIQLRVLGQMKRPRFTLLDTMNLWIATRRKALLKVIRRVDAVVLNDLEIRQLTGEHSLIKAARACLGLGPKWVFLKRGEHGAGLIGWLAKRGRTGFSDLCAGMAAGVVLSSFQVEGFSLERMERLKLSEIAGRLKALRSMTRF